MLSKMHFEMIAEAIAQARGEHAGTDIEELAIDGVVERLSERFAEDNPKFNRPLFEKAAANPNAS